MSTNPDTTNPVGPLVKVSRQQLAQILQDDTHAFLFSLGTIQGSGSWAVMKKGDGTVVNYFVTDIA